MIKLAVFLIGALFGAVGTIVFACFAIADKFERKPMYDEIYDPYYLEESDM